MSNACIVIDIYNYHQILKYMPINQPDKFIRKAYLFTLIYIDYDVYISFVYLLKDVLNFFHSLTFIK